MTRRFVLERRPTGHLGAPLLFVVTLPFVVGAAVFLLTASLSPEMRAALIVAAVLVAVVATIRSGRYLESLPFRVYLIVGDDGIRFHGKEDVVRFISHATIVSVTATEDGFVEIEHVRGGPISYRAVLRSADAAIDTHAREIADAIITDWRKFQANSRSLSDLPTLANVARSPHDQLAELRAIGAGRGENFRRAPLLRETLWRVAENPAVPSSERIAASVALRMGAVGDDMKRLRLIANASADALFVDKLRVAIDGNDDVTLERMLVEDVVASNSLPERLRRARR